MQFGLERLAEEASASGVGGLIVPDLPFEEAEPLKQALASKDVALIPLVGPNTSLERMQLYAQGAQGYAYVVSVLGVTGVREGLPKEVQATIARARQVFQVPLALGFGLNNPEQLANLSQEARPDAVVFGSALLKHIEAGGAGHSFLAKWL